MNNYIYGHTSAETAYLVKDYPYGFRLRTQIRYWLETTKQGDRFVSQTLNPKTGKWNKEKKSTYCKVGVMFLNEIGHVRWTGIHGGSWLDSVLAWCTEVGAENLTDAQYEQLKRTVAISAALEHIEWTIENVTFQTDEERAARELEQKEADKNLNRLINHEYNKLGA